MFRNVQISCAFRAELARALADTEWGDKSRRYFLTREEEHVGGLKAATAIWSVTSHSHVQQTMCTRCGSEKTYLAGTWCEQRRFRWRKEP